jgi:hypothetical protein
MSFLEKSFKVEEKIISSELAEFITNYFLLKKEVHTTLISTGYISSHTLLWGTYDDMQVPDSYSHYADIAMETLLKKIQPNLQDLVGLELVPTYSYARIYKKGDVLKRHKDRESCEISCTMNLGGDKWPIFIMGKDQKEYEVVLNPGDILIYRGHDLEHWREEFTGDCCVQVFLHYNDVNSQFGEANLNDGRLHLGLPKDICK